MRKSDQRVNRAAALLHSILSLPGVPCLLYPLSHGHAAVFHVHRFRDSQGRDEGCNPESLRRVLEYLRRNQYELVSLDELILRLEGRGAPIDRAVCITMDDGYLDQATVGAPLFAQYDCPVTVFVATGFLDGDLWFWWDKVEYVFRKTCKREIRVQLAGTDLTYRCEGRARKRATRDFVERCKTVSEADKQTAIETLAATAEIELPDECPSEYRPMSWEQARRCEDLGMQFGPHTVSHPVLSRTSEAQSRLEILRSWERLRAEARDPVPILAYPNGRWQDFGEREIGVLKSLNFRGAVMTAPGYTTRKMLQTDEDARYKLPRFEGVDRLSRVTRVVTGFERLRLMLPGASDR